MLLPILQAVRPADVMGLVARIATAIVGVLLLVPVVLARLPASWSAPFEGHTVVLRAAGVLVVLWFVGWLRALIYARLPTSAYLLGRTLVVPGRTPRRRRIALAEIVDVFVDLRPAPVHQMFVAELSNGESVDICPVHWKGAGRLYARLARRLRSR